MPDQQQRRQGADAEGEHGQGRLPGRGLGHGQGQGRVDQTAGQPAPDQSQFPGNEGVACRQVLAAEGFDVFPQFRAGHFEGLEAVEQLADIDAEQDEENARYLHRNGMGVRQTIHQLAGEQPSQQTDQHVGTDAAEVVAELNQPGMNGFAPGEIGVEGADDAATHADAVGGADQTHQQCREQGSAEHGVSAAASRS